MLAKITLENFFSFGAKTEIPLNKGVNILVGINGSGKSNLLKAIRLLHEGVAGKGFQKVFLEEFGGFDEMVNCSGHKKEYIRLIYEFNIEALREKKLDIVSSDNLCYDITLTRSGLGSYIIFESIYAKIGPHSPESPGHYYLKADNGYAKVSRLTESETISLVPTELALRQLIERNESHPINLLKKAIDSISTYQQFDTSPKSNLRLPVNPGIDERLSYDGVNIASLLRRMKNQQTLEFHKIVEGLQKINPKFQGIDFDGLGSKIFLALTEQNLAKTITVEHMSDGTLSFLLMSAIFGNPNRGRLVTLDEPENDLHPDMIGLIAKYMKEASRTTQIIAATHSPFLLNNFDFEDVLVFEKDDDNQTIVKYPTEEDFEGHENILVGQFWLRGLIGGTRW